MRDQTLAFPAAVERIVIGSGQITIEIRNDARRWRDHGHPSALDAGLAASPADASSPARPWPGRRPAPDAGRGASQADRGAAQSACAGSMSSWRIPPPAPAASPSGRGASERSVRMTLSLAFRRSRDHRGGSRAPPAAGLWHEPAHRPSAGLARAAAGARPAGDRLFVITTTHVRQRTLPNPLLPALAHSNWSGGGPKPVSHSVQRGLQEKEFRPCRPTKSP